MLQVILKENETVYFNYRKLMTGFHYKVLKAIAKEDAVDKPFSNQYIARYQLGSASSVKTTFEALLKRGILTHDKALYLTDWYFSLWLK